MDDDTSLTEEIVCVRTSTTFNDLRHDDDIGKDHNAELLEANGFQAPQVGPARWQVDLDKSSTAIHLKNSTDLKLLGCPSPS